METVGSLGLKGIYSFKGDSRSLYGELLNVSDIGLTYRYLSGKLSDILRRKFGHLLARYRLKNTGTTAKSQ